jgi:hypothetical protein
MRRRVLAIILLAICSVFVSCKKEESETTDTAATGTTETATTSSTDSAREEAHRRAFEDKPSLPPRTDCAGLPETDFEVEVVFTGLMMFVPDDLDLTKPLQVAKPGEHASTTWTVLIPNARGLSGATLPPDNAQTVHPHTPFVGVDPRYLCGESPKPKDTWCPNYAYYELEDADILWDSAFMRGQSGPPAYRLTVDGDGVCPTNKDGKTDGNSLHWIPSLAEVGFSDHRLDADLVGGTPKPNTISGRTTLQGGSLDACVLARPKMNFRVKRFENRGPVTRALAEEVHYTVKGRGETFTLMLAPRNGGTAEKVVLAPVDNRIEIRIGNVPKDYIPPTTTIGDPEAADAHFGAYHRFMKNVNAPFIPHDTLERCDSAPCMRRISRPCIPEGTTGQPGIGPSPEGANCGGIRP